MTCDKAGSRFIPLGYMFAQRHHKFDHSTDFKETSGGNLESKRTYHEDFSYDFVGCLQLFTYSKLMLFDDCLDGECEKFTLNDSMTWKFDLPLKEL